ncbi:MAG: hypothetical protein ACXWUN_01750 [Allosphingosinicella sp.]
MAVEQHEGADESPIPGTATDANRQEAKRPSPVLRVAVLVRGETRRLCHVREFSTDGVRARIATWLAPGEPVAIEVEAGRAYHGRIAWCRGVEAFITFERPPRSDSAPADPGSGRQKRGAHLASDRLAMIRSGADISFASTRDISRDGVRVMTDRPLPKGAAITFTLEGFQPIEGVVRGERGGLCVITFNQIIPPADLRRWLAS